MEERPPVCKEGFVSVCSAAGGPPGLKRCPPHWEELAACLGRAGGARGLVLGGFGQTRCHCTDVLLSLFSLRVSWLSQQKIPMAR